MHASGRVLVMVLSLAAGFLAHCVAPLSPQEQSERNDGALAADGVLTADGVLAADAAGPQDTSSPTPELAGERDTGASSSASFSWSQGEALAYQRQWDWKGARWESPSASYVFTNQLGYTIGIEAAYVGAVAMQLVACTSPEQHPMGWLSPWRRFGLHFGLPLARADHSFSNDVSLVSQPVVEVVIATEARLFGVAESSGVRYCQLHVLYAPLSQVADDGVSILRSSAVLKGWYQSPGGTQKVPIDATTSLVGGSLLTLERDPGVVSGELAKTDVSAYIKVTRSPVVALQDADLARMDAVEIAYHFLGRLSRGSSARVFVPQSAP